MNKKLVGWLVIGTIAILGFFAIYGARAWFYPSKTYVSLLAGPVVCLGLLCAYFVCRQAPAVFVSGRSRVRKPFLCIGIGFMLPMFFWSALIFGIPALAAKILGPNGTLVATVREKDTGTRSCRNRLIISERSSLFKEELCVRASLFDTLSEGQRVRLTVRENFFGTRVFAIDPS